MDGFILRLLVDLSYGYPLELENEQMMLNLLETASMLQVLFVARENLTINSNRIDYLLSFWQFKRGVLNSYSTV